MADFQFSKDQSNRCGDIADYQFFKIAAVSHLGFSKDENFNFRTGSEAQYAFVLRVLGPQGQHSPTNV